MSEQKDYELTKEFIKDAMVKAKQYPMTDDGKMTADWTSFLDDTSGKYASAILANVGVVESLESEM